MLKRLSVVIALTIWVGCATKTSAPAQITAPATAAPSIAPGSGTDSTDEQNAASNDVSSLSDARLSTPPHYRKQNKPTVRQMMPKLKRKVAPAGLVKPAYQTKLRYQMLLPRPTKSAI